MVDSNVNSTAVTVLNKLEVYSLLYSLFPRDRKTLAVPYLGTAAKGIVVMVDWSNIYIGYRQLNENNYLDLDVFSMILTHGRPCLHKILAGSQIPPSVTLKAHQLGYKVHMGTRAGSQEQGIDEFLSFSISEYTSNYPPAILAIATGDGQPSANQDVSFIASTTRALELGWIVELYCFGSSLSKNWLALAEHHPDKLCVVFLDQFVKGLRSIPCRKKPAIPLSGVQNVCPNETLVD
jgi:hypothetical protein